MEIVAVPKTVGSFLFHTIYISLTNARKCYSHFNSSFTIRINFNYSVQCDFKVYLYIYIYVPLHVSVSK
jgi:hypothetical protein